MMIRRVLSGTIAVTFLAILAPLATAQVSNLSVRAISANITSGNNSSYEQAGIDIFKALKPDVVAIQEFNYNGSTNNTDTRALVDTAFGTNYYYFRETKAGYSIPNGIVSRWPIIGSGSWTDPLPTLTQRGFAWAQIDLPGTNDLYVVSVHLYSGGSEAERNTEAIAVRSNILAIFPTNAWVIVGGDFNTPSRGEDAVLTLKTIVSDAPIPADKNGDQDTNAGRNAPYDYLLPSFSLTNKLVPVVMPSNTFSNGLVFDTRVYTPTNDLAPAVATNSGAFQMQHMAVVKNFLLPVFETNGAPVSPSIVIHPQSQTNTVGTPVDFFVAASGTAPLAYQWRLNGTNLSGATATNYSIASVQTTNAGDYTVIITNIAGKATSDVATLTVLLTNTPPTITTHPASQTNVAGTTANFFVTATGTAPLSYQWRFNDTNISATATNSTYSKSNVQTNDAGSYTVVITNIAGSVTSTPGLLTVTSAPPVVASGTNVVISQIYGGGGNTADATYRNDFVELFNPTASAVSLSGWTIQYSAAANSTWNASSLTGSIASYSYYLIQFPSGGANGAFLPTADATNTANNISATAGKLALVRTNTVLSGTNPLPNGSIADLIGYGSTASGYEGLGPVATISGNTNSLLRKDGGFTDSNNNTNDFVTLSPPAPRNSASPANPPPSNPPASAPTLSTPSLASGQLIFQLTGTTSSNYVVQVSTNLATTNWLPLQTNAAPFWFTNTIAEPQQFFRGTVAP